ncbi:MAG: tRNA (adenosine(37)-N6)-threonylcarbamoyltransferase complex transferase subunit TsaD [Parvularculales bacterium]
MPSSPPSAFVVLGLETSCDETAAAVVRWEAEGTGTILANEILSQTKEHAPYGGVVPEIAARSHILHLDGLIKRALDTAGLTKGNIEAVAATAGPGLVGGVMVGLTMGKAIALARGVPFVGVNHLEGHALTARLTGDTAFPYLLLLVSGGHTQLLAVKGVGDYRIYGTTLDDAAGEAFDKTARLLGLGWPGGPAVEKVARRGNASRFTLPRPLVGQPGADFSFSGLKSAVRRVVETNPVKDATLQADTAAAFQDAVADCLCDRTKSAMDMFAGELGGNNGNRLVVAGGVAANAVLREHLVRLVEENGFDCHMPPPALCTDNAAMIAWAGAERLARGYKNDALDMAPRARWPLDELVTTQALAG